MRTKIIIGAVVGLGLWYLWSRARNPRVAPSPPLAGVQIPTGPAPVTSAGLPSAGGSVVVTV